jgi:hypothetical protein
VVTPLPGWVWKDLKAADLAKATALADACDVSTLPARRRHTGRATPQPHAATPGHTRTKAHCPKLPHVPPSFLPSALLPALQDFISDDDFDSCAAVLARDACPDRCKAALKALSASATCSKLIQVTFVF